MKFKWQVDSITGTRESTGTLLGFVYANNTIYAMMLTESPERFAGFIERIEYDDVQAILPRRDGDNLP
jgi:hypothetical protein